jgi:hypothetical protein
MAVPTSATRNNGLDKVLARLRSVSMRAARFCGCYERQRLSAYSQDRSVHTDRRARRERTRALFRTEGLAFRESSRIRSSNVAMMVTSNVQEDVMVNSGLHCRQVE